MSALLWSFPAIMICSIVIGWAAEVAAIHISAGLALAILALLQTLPEFGVEAYISWTGNTHLMLANLTGSLRLFVGLGWPVVFFIHFFCSWKKKPRYVQMPKSFAVEATYLILPVLYFLWVAYKNVFTLFDGIVLCAMYLVYLLYLNVQRVYLKSCAEELDVDEDELESVPLYLSKKSLSVQKLAMIGMFIVGGGLLFFAVHPFVEGLKALAVYAGMSEFVFIQWVAPFASEFPEKITAFGWARKASKVPMAIFNMVSSSVNQWTLLAGFVPVVYSLSIGRAAVIPFDRFQHIELMLTISQSILGILFLADLKFHWFEAVALFGLWVIQFLVPSTREIMTVVYVLLIAVTVMRLVFYRRFPAAWVEFYKMNKWIFKRNLKKI